MSVDLVHCPECNANLSFGAPHRPPCSKTRIIVWTLEESVARLTAEVEALRQRTYDPATQVVVDRRKVELVNIGGITLALFRWLNPEAAPVGKPPRQVMPHMPGDASSGFICSLCGERGHTEVTCRPEAVPSDD